MSKVAEFRRRAKECFVLGSLLSQDQDSYERQSQDLKGNSGHR